MQIIQGLNLTGNVCAMLLFAVLGMVVMYLAPVRWRVFVLLAESILFYALCDFRFLGLLLFETILTWFCGQKIGENLNKSKAGDGDDVYSGTCGDDPASDASSGRRRADGYLVLGIVVVVLVLAIMKYAGFFASVFQFSSASLVMPLGISYYSFREISYLADIRMGKRGAEKSFVRYAAYVMLFLHIVSGPIARSEGILDQFRSGIRWSEQLACNGLCLVLSGMFKKLVIANRLSSYVDMIFSSYSSTTGTALWLAAVLYSIELYCDFAGYSEIAVGLTNLCGLPCELNFRQPYLANSMQQFWRRWHISLSSWLRDYIYIPLGGNRKGKLRKNLNVLAVFLVCGLWHGAGLTYVIWGLYHGIWNMLWRDHRGSEKKHGIRQVISCIGVFLVAMFGWIIFRSDSLPAAFEYLYRMMTQTSVSAATIEAAILPFTMDSSCVAYFLTVVIMIAVLLAIEWEENYHEGRFQKLANARNCLYLVLILLFGIEGTGSFLYANF